MRHTHEDVVAQVDRLTEAHLRLSATLEDLSKIAKRQAKAKTPDLDVVYAVVNAVRRAEEDVDTATLDLATARGEDA